MRSIISLGLLVLLSPHAAGQIKEERRFRVLYNAELYPQATPHQSVRALLRALDKERYDYLIAFLLEQNYVNDQLRITAANFEQAARAQVEGEKLEAKGFDQAFIRNRVRELAEQANFENLARRIRTKLDEDSEAVKELRKLYREGDLVEAGDTATLKHPDLKDRQLFFRNVNGRWYIENKMLSSE